MTAFTKKLVFSTDGGDDVIDITPKVTGVVSESKIKSGLVNVFVVGSTASVTTIEHEPGLIKDIKTVGERLAPKDINWAHNDTWGDGNGHSHLRASVIGPSLTVPVVKGEMTLGTWQQIVVIDHDIRPRKREVVVQIIGE
jgi:secondary thiamine-phosphate synthase enzyme